METLLIHPTDETDLDALQTLWNDGEVMHDVGFPQGLGTTTEKMHQWYAWLCAGRPQRDHFSIVMDDRFCGEAFYAIDAHGYAALDIKLFAFARSKGLGQRGLRHAIREAFHHGAHTVWVDPNQANDKALALYHRLGFRASSRPAHQEDTPGYVYLQLKKQDLKAPWGIDEPELWLASFQGPLPFEVSPTEVKTVLTTFCSSLDPLILTPLPAREKHKWILIAAVSREFEPQREYSEKEIMAVLKPMNPDPITIRRYLVDYRFLWRTRDGSQYGKVEHHD
jgi:RimJ/RimL family protein N-acetyltransferase